jgi:hypothetical protein
MLAAMRSAWLVLSLVTLTTGCYGFRRPGISGAVITSDPDAVAAQMPEAPPAGPVLDGLVVSAEEAAQRGVPSERLVIPFGPGVDGTQLLADFLEGARLRKAAAVDVHLVFVAGNGVECRVGVQPDGVDDPIAVPAGAKLVKAPAPQTLNVTEYERRCGTEYNCSHADTRIPYQRNYECRVVPGARPPTGHPGQSRCRTEAVTHKVSRFDFEQEAKFVPPHFEELQRGQLVETNPVCYAVPRGSDAPAQGNRLEGTLHILR